MASLSVALVLVTALAVGAAVSMAVPGLPIAAAIALGAAVAPPDPVAALAVGRAGLPPRLITLVEGEGLLNDATALTTLQVAVAAAVGGGFSMSNAVGRFAWAAVGGIVVGMLVASIIAAIRRRLDDPLLDNSLSLAVPFAAYLGAEELHMSLALHRRAPARRAARAIRRRPGEGQCAAVGPRLVALSWAGTRGVITMAAIFTVPLTLKSGQPFPMRNLLLFCAYAVVVVTLVGQGLTFGPLLRRLRLSSSAVDEALVRNQARLAAVRASLDRLDETLTDDPQPRGLVEPLREAALQRQARYAERVERLSAVEDGVLPVDDSYYAAVHLRRVMIDAERETLVEWRNAGRLPDVSLRVLQRELDHEEGLLPTGKPKLAQ